MIIKCLGSGSDGNSFAISDGKTNLLLDLGLSWANIMHRSNCVRFDACLVSHSHKDHSRCLEYSMKTGIPIYVSRQTINELNLEPSWSTQDIDEIGLIVVNTFKIIPFKLVHDVVNYGFCIESTYTKEKLVYMTDTMYCPNIFRGVTHWLLECNYIKDIIDENVRTKDITPELRNRIIRSHMSLETVKDLLAANDLRWTQTIYMMHLSNNNSDASIIKKEIQILTGKEVIIF